MKSRNPIINMVTDIFENYEEYTFLSKLSRFRTGIPRNLKIIQSGLGLGSGLGLPKTMMIEFDTLTLQVDQKVLKWSSNNQYSDDHNHEFLSNIKIKRYSRAKERKIIVVAVQTQLSFVQVVVAAWTLIRTLLVLAYHSRSYMDFNKFLVWRGVERIIYLAFMWLFVVLYQLIFY